MLWILRYKTNIQSVRNIQNEIHDYYAADASKYDKEKKLKIRRIYVFCTYCNLLYFTIMLVNNRL